MLDNIWPLAFLILLLAEPVRVFLMWLVLRLCGNSRQKAAAWALKQADKDRTLALVRVLRSRADPTAKTDVF